MGMGHLLRGCKDNHFLGAQQEAPHPTKKIMDIE
jgi:hypothetical protein